MHFLVIFWICAYTINCIDIILVTVHLPHKSFIIVKAAGFNASGTYSANIFSIILEPHKSILNIYRLLEPKYFLRTQRHMPHANCKLMSTVLQKSAFHVTAFLPEWSKSQLANICGRPQICLTGSSHVFLTAFNC